MNFLKLNLKWKYRDTRIPQWFRYSALDNLARFLDIFGQNYAGIWFHNMPWVFMWVPQSGYSTIRGPHHPLKKLWAPKVCHSQSPRQRKISAEVDGRERNICPNDKTPLTDHTLNATEFSIAIISKWGPKVQWFDKMHLSHVYHDRSIFKFKFKFKAIWVLDLIPWELYGGSSNSSGISGLIFFKREFWFSLEGIGRQYSIVPWK